jgi:glutamyl-tRNA reductase
LGDSNWKRLKRFGRVSLRRFVRLWHAADEATEGPERVRDNIILVGTNHTRASISVRERLALSSEALATSLSNRPAGFGGLAILSTCNRSEFYALAPGDRSGAVGLTSWISDQTGISGPDLADATYTKSGHDAVTHLFNVASGLDSMVLGEPHILGQVRKAFDLAMEAGAAGPVLCRLGQDAVHVGKTVRTQTGLARNRLSIPHAAVDLASRSIKSWSNCRAVVIGAGEMGSLTAKLLRSTGAGDIVVVNRNKARGRALAETVHGRFAPLGELASEVKSADLVISAVAVEDFILRRTTVEARIKPLVIVDLGVPRTVDPELKQADSTRLLDVDDLENFSAERRDTSSGDIEHAETLIEDARDSFLRWWAARESAPAIAELIGKAEEIRETELDRALRKLSHLSDRDRNIVAAMSVGIVNKLLHEPITNLRGSLDGGEAATAMRRLFNLETEPVENHHPEPIDGESRIAAWDKGQ